MIQQDYNYNATIIGVVDGDTIDLDIDLGFYTHSLQRVRLARIDTPETNSKDPDQRMKAINAKTFVTLCMHRPVTIKSFKQDKYGRFLAEVYFADGQSLNQILLDRGFAVPYSGGKKQETI